MVQSVFQAKSEIIIKVSASAKKNICEKYYISNPATCSCEKSKYLPSIIDDSAITLMKL